MMRMAALSQVGRNGLPKAMPLASSQLQRGLGMVLMDGTRRRAEGARLVRLRLFRRIRHSMHTGRRTAIPSRMTRMAERGRWIRRIAPTTKIAFWRLQHSSAPDMSLSGGQRKLEEKLFIPLGSLCPIFRRAQRRRYALCSLEASAAFVYA